MFTKTLLQFANAMRDEYLADSYGITRAEYDECYPVQSRLTDWLKAIDSAADSGEQIHPRVLDRLAALRADEYPCIQFIKFHRHAIPQGYMLPSARRKNREYSRTLIAARKQGKQESK